MRKNNLKKKTIKRCVPPTAAAAAAAVDVTAEQNSRLLTKASAPRVKCFIITELPEGVGKMFKKEGRRVEERRRF